MKVDEVQDFITFIEDYDQFFPPFMQVNSPMSSCDVAPFVGRFNFLYVFVAVALSSRSSPWAELRILLRAAGWRICQRCCLGTQPI